ncbi:MAG: ribosomal protein S18-alanine N-acetyltransferase [Acidobacteriia bacterium]|nr:ribosomal protein S18-alanine N-acetyltransferase [Terriglobia bacterium]
MKQACAIQVAVLTALDIPALEPLEEVTHLCYWGTEHYTRFLEQQEYFARKAVITVEPGLTRLVGFFLARSILENLELLKIGVYPEFQNGGIGTRLLNAAFAEGAKRGCLRCFLEVRKSNESAIHFYHNHLFKIAGERINYYTEPVEDAWIMERWL